MWLYARLETVLLLAWTQTSHVTLEEGLCLWLCSSNDYPPYSCGIVTKEFYGVAEHLCFRIWRTCSLCLGLSKQKLQGRQDEPRQPRWIHEPGGLSCLPTPSLIASWIFTVCKDRDPAFKHNGQHLCPRTVVLDTNKHALPFFCPGLQHAHVSRDRHRHTHFCNVLRLFRVSDEHKDILWGWHDSRRQG